MATTTTRKYTNISFDDIRDQLISILKAKGGSKADFGESSYGRTLIELFAGYADLNAFYAESSFENAFLESAYSKPSVYSGARMLGYSIRRPIPAKASFGIQTKKTGIYNTIRVHIPLGTQFSISGPTLTALDDIEFSYSKNDDVDLTGLMSLTSGRAILAEGSFKTTTLMSNGKQNQSFIISDTNFSDYFGDNDPNATDDASFTQRKNRFTTVSSDASLMDNFDPSDAIDDRIYWRIDRRGLIDPSLENTINDIDEFIDGQSNYTINYSVKIITANDETVMLKFGDGLKSAIPYGEITVKYFSTNGESGNLLNISGTTISPSGTNIIITQEDGTESDITLNDLNIAVTTDIRGGLNIETFDSIKNNASSIYNTLEHLINRLSYKIFLRRYSDVKYANAFGEDILNTKLANGSINVKYMNQIRFTALKDLYREKNGSYYPTSSDEYFLDGFKVNGLMYMWQYDYENVPSNDETIKFAKAINNVYSTCLESINNGSGPFSTESDLQTFFSTYMNPYLNAYTMPMDNTVFAAHLTPYDFVESGSEIDTIMRTLNRRGMITTGAGYHMFAYPIVHNFKILIDLILYKGHTFTDIKEKIQNSLYKYLKEHTEFATPIYASKMNALIHEFLEVAGVNISFSVVDNGYGDLDLNDLTWLGDNTSEFITPGSISLDGFDINLSYTYVYNSNTKSYLTDSVISTYTIEGQENLSTIISNYYNGISSDNNGLRVINIANKRKNGTLTENDIDDFVAFIWHSIMQCVYEPIYNEYTASVSAGKNDTAVKSYALLTAIKGWSSDGESLQFVDTDSITTLVEYNGTAFFDYIRYGLEYIKLVRNILGYDVAKQLIDSNGNISKYSNENEIVQFTVSPENITLTVSPETVLIQD